jgi:signal transduction histidine kinase
MRPPIKERTFTIAMVILATVVVIVLAALQYRWSNQVSEATSSRLADSLQMSMINWHLDLFRDFSEICIALRVDPEIDAQVEWGQYARGFAEWKKTTAHPDLVSNAYVLRFNEGPDTNALRIDPVSRRLERISLPPNFAALRQELRETPSPTTTAAGVNEYPDAPSSATNREFADFFYAGGPLDGWKFESRIPALVRPIARADSSNTGPQGGNSREMDWLVIALNQENFQNQILPDLAQRYFRGTEGLDYQVAVVAGGNPQRVIYSSDSDFGQREVTDADGTMNIFGRGQNSLQGSPVQIFHTSTENKGPAASVGITWFPLVQQANDQDWRLVLRHRRGGPLGAFVADSRRRDLAISFGVLLLLVISIAILIITSTRAQRLAQLQMDFVTAVSHELRTPLTVISSAAENITHGVVEGRQQLEQYGAVIGAQARKLFEMVEQILLFAAIREGHQRYSIRPLEVTEILEAALSSTAGLIQAANFRVDMNVEPNLPRILGDLSALSRSVQNLITNALKYGSDQRWIGVQARITEHGLGGKEIQISIADHGIGIDPRELPHIFQPFYRSPSVTAAQIHGTGLGLPLAKSIVESMKGHLSVKSIPGRGSTFTVHLPCIEHPLRQADAKATEAIST